MNGLQLTSGNIGYFASFLHSSVDIQERVIHFPSGTADEQLLEVPLGQVDPHATIVITVGLDHSHPNTPGIDSDFIVGISDGTNSNTQWITDVNNYPTWASCLPINGQHDDIRLLSGTQVAATYKLTFNPFYKYAACETAQQGGYINTGTFNDQVDTNQPLYLVVNRQNAPEEYYFHYLDVQIY